MRLKKDAVCLGFARNGLALRAHGRLRAWGAWTGVREENDSGYNRALPAGIAVRLPFVTRCSRP